MTTKEAAEKTKVSSTYISEVESGKKCPSYPVLKRMAAAYNIPHSRILLFE